MHSRTAVFVTLVLAIVTSQYPTLSVILRPHWFPYFRDNTGTRFLSGQIPATILSVVDLSGTTVRGLRGERHLQHEDIPCPPDMTEYECYHTFMAAWTRLLKKEKRLYRLL